MQLSSELKGIDNIRFADQTTKLDFSRDFADKRLTARPLRLVAQDIGFSVRRQGFDSPRGYLVA